MGEWAHRRAITIRNPNDAGLRDFQVRIELNATNFDFDRALPDGADLRFTDGSGTKVLGHWVERFDAAANRAIVWVKVPDVPAGVTTQAYVYYGHPAVEDLSSGRRTFEMFDDFGLPGPGYYEFGPPTTVMTRTEAWETQAPHTLSVVELNRDGYTYWGYYGLADCGGIGLARSNDLLHWDKVPQPLLNADGERWPAAINVGGRIYMIYDRDHCGTSHLVMRTSADGRTFDPTYDVIVAQEQGVRNQNPALFRDPNTGRFHLYWFRGGGDVGFWQIRTRSAETVEGLADPAGERVLLDVPYELAAPNMMYADGTYFLSTEVNENAWKTRIYSGPSPDGPFAPLPDAPQLSDNQACLFQHTIGATMHGYLCKVVGAEWVLNHRAADLSQGRMAQRALDLGVWTPLQGAWSPADDGRNIVLGAAEAGLVRTALIGRDYVVESRGRSADATWGVAARVNEPDAAVVASVRPDGVVQIARLGPEAGVLAMGRVDGFDGEQWHTLGLAVSGEGEQTRVEAHLDGRVITSAVGALDELRSGNAGLLAEGRAQFDDVRWRKLAPEEPLARVGPREDRPNATAPAAPWLAATRPAPARAADATGAGPLLVIMAAVVTALGLGVVILGLARNRG
jgi:hypothetical protein